MLFSSLVAGALATVLPQWVLQGMQPQLQPQPQTQAADLSKILDELRQRWSIQGVSAVIVQHPNHTKSGDWSVDTYTLGSRDRHGNPVTDDTLFEIASNSKLFAAIATGLLVHNETLAPRLAWDSKLADFIPEWELSDPVASKEADLRDILSHRSGLPRHEFMYESTWSSREYVKKLRHVKPSTGFRQNYQYCNAHYVAASVLPEAILGVRFWDFVQEHIFEPLGMTSTLYNVTMATASGRRADGFVRFDRDMAFCAQSLHDINWDQIAQDENYSVPPSCRGELKAIGWPTHGDATSQAGPGGVISCARDLTTWLKMLLLKGKDPRSGKQVIPEAVIDEVAKGTTVPSGLPGWPEVSVETYGMGQQRYHYRGHEVIEHFGGDPGFMSVVSRIPDRGLGVAITTNDDSYGTAYHMIAKYRIFDAMLGLEPIKWEERLAKTMIAVVPNVRARPSRPEMPAKGVAPLAGTYHHGAYGTVTLCPVAETMTSEDATVMTLPAGCKETLATQPFPVTDMDAPTFVAAVNKTWISHFALTHFTGNMFNFTTASFYPDTNLTSLSFEPSYENVFAQFDDDGYGMAGGFWGAARGIGYGDIEHKGVKEGAEVYFDRID